MYLSRNPVERSLRRAVGYAPNRECDHDPTDARNDGADSNVPRRCAFLEEVSHGLEEYDGSSNVDLEERV